MEELYLRNSRFIPEKEWLKEIDHLKSEESLKNKKEAKEQLKKIITEAVKKRIPRQKFGILFSGGVDSSLIAILSKKLGGNFICYTVGFQEGETKIPEDIVEAKKVAKRFSFRLKYQIYNLNEIKKTLKKTLKILKPVNKTDVVSVGVGSVILAALELGKKDKIHYFLSGLGSEELFAGYERYSQAKNINQECWQGLKMMYQRDLVRDFNLAEELGAEIRTPFLDQELIKYALKIPGEWKLNKSHKKIILREIAEESLGKFAWRKKKAAQYGSCFDKALEKLAKKSGFKKKKEWIESIINKI